MARRLPKFPLEMTNGEKVRNIEDLRKNADVDSIVKYFFSGQLNLWCRAFGYDNLPEQFENINVRLIKSIYETLEISVDESEIENYVKERGIRVSGKPNMNAENDDEIIDDEELKNKLQSYVDPEVNLSDYAIDLLPVNSTLTVVRILFKKDSSRFNNIHDDSIGFRRDDWIYQNIALMLWAVHRIKHPVITQPPKLQWQLPEVQEIETMISHPSRAELKRNKKTTKL